MKPKTNIDYDDMLPEYDFTGAVRGKYYERYRQGTNVVLLDPDVAEVFRDAKTVNDALRLLVSIAEAKVLGKPVGSFTRELPKKPAQQAIRRKRTDETRKSAKAGRD